LLSDAIDNREASPYGLRGYHLPEAQVMRRYITDELPKKPITTHIVHNVRWSRENMVSVDEALFAQTTLSEEDRKAVLKLLEGLSVVGKGDRSRLAVGIQPSYISEFVPNSCLPGFLMLSKESG